MYEPILDNRAWLDSMHWRPVSTKNPTYEPSRWYTKTDLAIALVTER